MSLNIGNMFLPGIAPGCLFIYLLKLLVYCYESYQFDM